MKKRRYFQVRISKEEEELIEKASNVSDSTKSSIILTGAIKEAKKVLRKMEKDS